jgi:plasmid stabilization system protein ParE
MKVRFSREALADLDEIFTYIRERNPVAASDLAQRIEHLTGLIGHYPYRRNDLIVFVVRSGALSTSHSQITSVFQPIVFKLSRLRASRVTFRASFGAQ